LVALSGRYPKKLPSKEFDRVFGLVPVFSVLRVYENENTRSALKIIASVEAGGSPLETNPAGR